MSIVYITSVNYNGNRFGIVRSPGEVSQNPRYRTTHETLTDEDRDRERSEVGSSRERRARTRQLAGRGGGEPASATHTRTTCSEAMDVHTDVCEASEKE